MLQRFKVKHSKGVTSLFASDELDAFKMAIARNAEDIEAITERTDNNRARRVSHKWIVYPPARK